MPSLITRPIVLIYNGQGNPYGNITLSANGTLFGMTNLGGSSGKGCVFRVSSGPTGVNDLAAKTTGGVSVFPNPSNGKYNIATTAVKEETEMNIYNAMGENVLSERLNKAEANTYLDLSSQPCGVYLYRVITISGNLVGR